MFHFKSSLLCIYIFLHVWTTYNLTANESIAGLFLKSQFGQSVFNFERIWYMTNLFLEIECRFLFAPENAMFVVVSSEICAWRVHDMAGNDRHTWCSVFILLFVLQQISWSCSRDRHLFGSSSGATTSPASQWRWQKVGTLYTPLRNVHKRFVGNGNTQKGSEDR